uniref:Ras-like protein n=1 Tax=Peronospora matthiolae TaxID=2874970 RepID=A0AAV1TS85_9STRA
METPSVRVLVVGDSGVGKTTLLRALCRSQSPGHSSALEKPPTGWTTGCDVHVLLQALGPDGREVFVEFLDVGGHRQYERSRRAFYVDVHGVMFVHDLSNVKSGDRLCHWSRELRTVQRLKGCVVPLPSGHGKQQDASTLHELPKLVVGSKRDLVTATSGARTKGPMAVADFRTALCMESSAKERLSVEPSAVFATFLRRALAFANRKHGDSSLRSCDNSSSFGLRQLVSRSPTDEEDKRLKSGNASSSAAQVPPLLSSESHSNWW